MKRAMTILLAVLLLAAAAQMISPPGAAADPGNAPPTPPAIGSPSAVGGTPGGRNLPPTVPVIAMPTGNAPVIAVPTGSAPTPPPIVAAPTIAPLPTIAATIPVTATSVPATRNAPPTVAPTPTSGATPTGTGTGTAAPTVCPTGTATGTPITTATGTLTATATHAATGTATACATVTAPTAPLTTATASAAPVAPTACPATNTLTGQTAALVPPALAQREVTGSRTRTTRTYNAGKGQLQTVIGSGSLNFKDTQGKWQPIDNTLVAGAASGYAYQNKANGYTAAFPGGLAANPVRVTRGNAWVSFALAGANGTSTTCANQIVYANALPGVAVTYAAENDAVTETLTLASAVAPNAYPFAVRTSGDLTARAAKNGGIQFVDKAGTVVFTFAPPTMHDSAKKRATGTVSLQLATTNGGTTATIVADTAWLKDPARVYPVIIDPPVTVGPYNATAMCVLSQSDPGRNYCDAGDLAYTNTNTLHIVMKFDLSQFNSNVTITDAAVHLAYRSEDDSNRNDINPPIVEDVSVHRVIRDWDPACVTWDNRGCGTPWGDYPGGVIDVSDGSTIAVPDACSNQDCVWNTKNMVQQWVRDASTNDGMRFDDDDNAHINDDVYMHFWPRGGNNQPFLSITYDDPGSTGSTGPAIGGRPFYTLVGGQIDDRLSLGVNVQSGNLLVTANDLTIAGTGLNLAITRSYNSLAVYKGIFGNHWAMNGGPDLFVLILPNTNDVILQNNTGYRVGFTDNGNGNYQHVPGLDADLYRYGDGSYTLTYHANNFQYRFDNTGRLTWQQDKNGNRINYAYNGTQLDHIEDTEGRWVRFEYGGGTNGKYVSHIHDDYGNRDVYYGYQGDNLHQVTDANGGVTYFDYDTGSGNLQRITDPRTNVTTFGYTGGALSRVQDIGRPGIPTTHLDYPSGDGTGAGSTVVTDPNGHGVFLQYDTHGLVTHTDQYGHTTDYLYNDDYHVTSAKDGYGNETRYQYNAGDSERLTDTYLPTGAHASTSYGGCNQPTQYYACGMTDAQGHSVRYGYSGFNVSDVTNDLGGTVHTDYDGQGRPTAARDARGNTTHYGYGGPGAPHHELSRITPPYVAPNTLGNSALAYDNVSRKTSVMDGKGQVTQYTYDTLDRPQTVTYSGNDQIIYSYDANGNRVLRQEGAGTTGFAYDALNRQTSKTLPSGARIGYGYDSAGNLIALTDAGGTVQYAYDQWNLLDHLVEPNGAQTAFGYDFNNVHTTTTYPGGTTLTLDHDTSERLTAITGMAGGATLTQYTYAYASGGTDTSLRQTMTDDVTGTTTAYGYDALNRLVGAVATGGQPSSYQYGYDLNGNRTSTVIGGVGTSATFNAVDEQVDWNTGQDRTYTYDGNGNETGSSGGEARTYNSRDQTVSITGLNGALTPINYLDGGQSERTDAGGSHYVTSSLGIGSETKNGQTTYYTRTPSGRLVSQRTPTGSLYYLFDGLGSVVGLVDAVGDLVARYGYDPSGQTVVKRGPDSNPAFTAAAEGNPFRYTGAYLDATGLYKMGERYYDPARGRFTQLDPLGNGYVYASDDPINRVDPSGLIDGDPSEDNNPPPGGKPDGNPDFPMAPPGGGEFDSGPFHFEPTGESRCSSDYTLQYEYEIHTYDLPSESYKGTVWLDSTDPCPSCNDTRLAVDRRLSSWVPSSGSGQSAPLVLVTPQGAYLRP